MVVMEVRRSERLKGKSKGYKNDACLSKACLCCSAEPPTLSDKVIRNLGKEFCKMPSRMMPDAALKKKPMAKRVAMPPKSKSSKSNKQSKKNNGDKPSKRSKKE
jgi:hypothetical protein